MNISVLILQNLLINIVNDPGLTINQYDNKIDIFLDNEDSIGSSFLLQILYDNKVLAELKITIIE